MRMRKYRAFYAEKGEGVRDPQSLPHACSSHLHRLKVRFNLFNIHTHITTWVTKQAARRMAAKDLIWIPAIIVIPNWFLFRCVVSLYKWTLPSLIHLRYPQNVTSSIVCYASIGLSVLYWVELLSVFFQIYASCLQSNLCPLCLCRQYDICCQCDLYCLRLVNCAFIIVVSLGW